MASTLSRLASFVSRAMRSPEPPAAGPDDDLLAELNADLPARDWKQGALDYVAAFIEQCGEAQTERLTATKPLSDIDPAHPEASILEITQYLHNFANAVRLLQMPRGARVLDVACGGGWVSHWLAKIGYRTLGIDISPDFARLARRRMEADPHLLRDPVEEPFLVHDIEAAPLPSANDASFDAAILESCLHHFLDPVAALRNIARALKPDGVVLVLEGENRKGPIHPDYLAVMEATSTLERPLPRPLMVEALRRAGFPHVEFLGSINGLFPKCAPLSGQLTAHLADATEGANNCLCAKSAEAMRRLIPSYAG